MGAAFFNEPPFCGVKDAQLFGGGDAFCRAAVAGVGTAAYFNKYERFAIKADDVDFAAPAAHVASDDFEALLGKPSCREGFGLSAAGSRCGRWRIHNQVLSWFF